MLIKKYQIRRLEPQSLIISYNKAVSLKRMHSRYNSPVTGSSSLSFTERLTKNSSLKQLKHENKQNVAFAHSPHQKRQQSNLHPLKENSSSALNTSKRIEMKTHATSKVSLRQANYQNSNLPSERIHKNSILRSSDDINSRNASKSIRNKSVKFNDQHIQIAKVQSSVNLGNEVPRKRSSSILKSSQKFSSFQQPKSKSNFKYEQNKLGNVFTIRQYKNTLVRERYNQIMRSFQKNIQQNGSTIYSGLSCYEKKFTDHNFWLSFSSVFKKSGKKANDLKWVRISELYKTKNVVLISNRSSFYKAAAGEYGNKEFAAMLNLIGQSRSLLNRIFQNSTFNQMGVYMLKIFHEQEWKCVIIDDYVPVVTNTAQKDQKDQKGSYQLLFTELAKKQGNQVEIWPFLLEKAYASLLGCYQTLHQSDLLSYIVELMGLPLSKVNIKDYKTLDSSCIMFTFLKSSCENRLQHHQLQRLVSLSIQEGSKNEDQIIQVQHYLSHLKQKRTLKQLANEVKELFIIKVSNMQYSVNVNIGTFLSLGKKIKSKRFFRENIEQNMSQFSREKSIIKTFTLSAPQEVSILLNFKKTMNRQATTRSSWLRVLLLMKQYDGYRWIEGKYSKQFIYFSCLLEAGDYYVIIIPDWAENYSSQLSLIAYSRVNKLDLRSYTECPQQKMIQKGCTDYAQRKGRLIQINKWICAYTIVDPESGLIIENINNQRRNGPIKIYRSIKNLKPKESYLLPYNNEFYSNSSTNNQISISIDKLQSYSIVMLMFGGKDSTFLDSFSFGP